MGTVDEGMGLGGCCMWWGKGWMTLKVFKDSNGHLGWLRRGISVD